MIRLASIVPLLAAEGFVSSPLTRDWQEFATLTDGQRTTLRDRHGLWIRVHPLDHEQLLAIGLDFQRDAEGRPSYQAPLVEVEPVAPSKPPPRDDDDDTEDNNTNTKAPSSGGKPKRKDR